MSGLLRDDLDPLATASVPKLNKSQGTLLENTVAAFDAGLMQSGTSEERYIKETWDPIVDEIEAITGKSFKNPGDYLRPNVFAILTGEAMRGYGPARYSYETNEIEKFVRDNRESLPEKMVVSILDPDRDTVWREAARDKYFQEQQDLSDVTARSPGLAAGAARLAGFIAAGAEDPLNQAFMVTPVGASRTFAGLMLKEAIVNAGAEAIQQPQIADWYASLGIDYSWQDFAENVGGAAAAGAALPLAFRIGGQTVRITAEQAKQGAKVISDYIAKRDGRKPSSLQGAEMLSEQADAVVDANPLQPSQKADVEHNQRLREADIAIHNGQIPKISERPESPVKVPQDINDVGVRGAGAEKFNPADIQIDAKTFQFKEGGDEFGVTDRLAGITEWDPIKAGTVIIYERADGGLFIADGHQRVGLAKRIQEASPDQQVELLGYRLREVDGVSTEEAMVIAALKNISEGSGTIIDAAKIARIAPERLSGPDFPKTSAFVKQARALGNLDARAWGMVKNEVVPANYGAAVGRLIPQDGDLQLAAMDVLAKVEPANEFQAESIIRQVMESGVTRETQESLFGEEALTTSLFLERAKVLDRAVKQLRKDRGAFKNLITNAERLEGEGNQLARQANERRANDDGKAIALLQSQANRKGGLSDALSAAARQAKETGNFNAAARSFVEDVRRAVDAGEFDRAEVSDAGRAFDFAEEKPAIRTDADQQSLDEFGDMFGSGMERQASALQEGLRQDLTDQKIQMRDLERLVKSGAAEEEIINHPAIINAVEEMYARPRTDQQPGFPQSPEDTASIEWFNNRRYITGVSNDATYEDTIKYLIKGARELGWVDDKLDFPVDGVVKQRKAAIILGPPAAGKSTIANPLARKMNAAIVDADEAKKVIPEYEGGIGANAVHEESSILSDVVFKVLMDQGDNLVIPKVGGKAASIERTISMLKAKGYEVELVDMKVGPEEAMKRMVARFIGTGRLIPPDFVKSTGINPSKTYDSIKAKGLADGYARIDNEGPKDAFKDVLEDTRNLFDGVELRLRRGGIESGPEIRRVDRPATVGESAESFERIDVPTIEDEFLDREFVIEVLDEFDADGNPVVRTVTSKQLFDEIEKDDAMIDALSRCPL